MKQLFRYNPHRSVIHWKRETNEINPMITLACLWRQFLGGSKTKASSIADLKGERLEFWDATAVIVCGNRERMSPEICAAGTLEIAGCKPICVCMAWKFTKLGKKLLENSRTNNSQSFLRSETAFLTGRVQRELNSLNTEDILALDCGYCGPATANLK